MQNEKNKKKKAGIKEMAKYILCAIYVLFSVSGLLIIKIASTAESTKSFVVPLLNFKVSWLSILGIICYGISFCLYLGVVSNFNIGFIIPLLGGVVNVLILLASTFILREGLGLKSIIGALIIVVGIMVMNF